tara:strand:- start:20518 stop:20880 length:363 start_codon:yes stop_codon:yes gene_type:complete
MGTIKTYQEQVQDIVSKVISTVEEQHKAIAATSFEYIEKLYKLDTVKAKHDEVADIAYSKAREVNKIVADYTADIIAKFEKEETTVTKAKAAVKKTTATAKKKATKAVNTAASKVEEATA